MIEIFSKFVETCRKRIEMRNNDPTKHIIFYPKIKLGNYMRLKNLM